MTDVIDGPPGQRDDAAARPIPPGAHSPQPSPSASARSRRGLDWLVFFIADVQTGFGPFIAVFLTTQKWTQADIGLVLTIGSLVSLGGQIPLGAFVDRLKALRPAIAVSLLLIGGAALAFALWPVFAVVAASRVVHAAASCVAGLALVSMSVRLAAPGQVGARLGRNAAFASAGTGIAAAAMGAVGYYLSSHAVFYLTALMVVPALLALARIRPDEIAAPPAIRQDAEEGRGEAKVGLAAGLLALARNRPLVIFAGCVMAFHLANAAMLPLAASMLTMRSTEAATVMVAAAMVVPQFTVTILSPLAGRLAQSLGRRPVLLAGFGALAVRGLLFATVTDPVGLVAIQILDGLSAAVFGVLVPLVVFDLTHRSGHFNLAQGAVGCAMGIGASISTLLAGIVADRFGSFAAFEMLAALATLGFLAVLVAMPETRRREEDAAISAASPDGAR